MAVIPQMTPDEIYAVLVSRLGRTNMLYGVFSEDVPVEMEKTIYFKYYFDVSTAIEATIRGITYEESKNKAYIKYLAEPASDSKSFFLKYEELKALVKLESLYENIDKTIFENEYCKKTLVLQNYNATKSFNNQGDFVEYYSAIRKVRNTLAHGLNSTNLVTFDQTTLESFLFVLYLLLNYYKKLYRD